MLVQVDAAKPHQIQEESEPSCAPMPQPLANSDYVGVEMSKVESSDRPSCVECLADEVYDRVECPDDGSHEADFLDSGPELKSSGDTLFKEGQVVKRKVSHDKFS